ncbi:TPA: hypothetical protein ACG0AO_000873 [Elizabethkingia meningoseptica]
MKNKILLIIILPLLVTSCCLFQGGGMTHRNANSSATMIRSSRFDTGNTVFNSFYDASKRSTVIVAKENYFAVLAENTPDAITSKALDIIANADVKKDVTASAKISMAQTAIQLNKKSSVNIFSANALYRLNEMYTNTLGIDSLEEASEYKERGEISYIKTHPKRKQALETSDYVSLFKAILSTSATISESEATIASKQNFDDVNAKLEKVDKSINDQIKTNKKQDSINNSMMKKLDNIILKLETNNKKEESEKDTTKK